MAKVLHASYSGYFPECIVQSPPPTTSEIETQGFQVAIPITLQEAMFLFWKSKRMVLSIGGQIANGPDPIYAVRDYFGQTSQTIWQSPYSTEDEIVCQSVGYTMGGTITTEGFYRVPYDPPIDTPEGIYYNFGIQLSQKDWHQGDSSGVVMATNDTYYALLRLFVFGAFSGNYSLNGSGSVVGSFTINLGGEDYSIDIKGVDQEAFSYGFSGSLIFAELFQYN